MKMGTLEQVLKLIWRINVGKFIYRIIWNLSEYTGIGLGRFAPYVFHQMIGGETPFYKVRQISKRKQQSHD
jgi:hypothetical protein